MTTLVTGGCGFVGSFVVKRLAGRGERVISYDINSDRRHLDSVLSDDEREMVQAERGDTLDMAHLMTVASKWKVNRIAHIAYLGRKATLANPAWAQQANIVGTNNIFELAIFLGAPLVWTSTIDVFGPQSVGPEGVIRVDAPYDPANIYGSCKAHNEVTAREYSELRGLSSLAVRLPPVFGPSYFPINSWVYFLPKVISSIVHTGRGEYPSLDENFPFGYVDDVASAIVAGIEAPEVISGVVTLGGMQVSTQGLLKAVQDRFPDAELTPMDYPRLGVISQYDTEPAQKLLGWQARVSPAEGVERIARYYEGVAGRSPLGGAA